MAEPPPSAGAGVAAEGSGATGRSSLARFLRQPLVVFLVLGALLFFLDGKVRRQRDDSSRIVVDTGQLDHLRALFEVQRERPPDDAELELLIRDHVLEEVLYREALRLGLDQNDAVVRRRLVQKMGFLLDGEGGAEPSEDELLAYFAAHAEVYREPARFTFVHVFLSPEARGEGIEAEAQRLLDELSSAAGRPDDESWRQEGDPFLLQREFTSRSSSELIELFGADFAAALETAAIGAWVGPLRSPWGHHLVRLDARQEARSPAFEEVRERVVADFLEQRRAGQRQRALEALRGRYEVTIEGRE